MRCCGSIVLAHGDQQSQDARFSFRTSVQSFNWKIYPASVPFSAQRMEKYFLEPPSSITLSFLACHINSPDFAAAPQQMFGGIW